MPGSYLASVVQLLWPPPSEVTGSARRTRAAADSYVVFPTAGRPKLLIPSRPRRVAAGAVRGFKTASSTREQARISAIAAAFRLGLHDLLPDRIGVRSSAGELGGIDAHLSQVVGRRAWVCLYISPPRAVRKPVLQVLDEQGTSFAFAKLGIDAFTRELVRAEAAAVTRVGAVEWSVLRAPEVLHSGTWNGHELLVQSALPRGQAIRAGSPLLHRAMQELARIDPVSTTALADSGYLARLTQRVNELPGTPLRAVLIEGLAAVEHTAGATELTFGASHGDWAPWNMTEADGRVLVWDWEKFESDVPIGIDAVHCAVQGAVVLDGASPVAAFRDALGRAEQLLRETNGGPAAAVVVWLYALDIASRYLVDREQEAGSTRMGELAGWLAEVLALAASQMDGRAGAS